MKKRSEIHIAVWGNAPSTVRFIKNAGIVHCDQFPEGIDCVDSIREKQTRYDLIIILAESAMSINDMTWTYKLGKNETHTCPILFVSEPISTPSEVWLKLTIDAMQKICDKKEPTEEPK